MHTHAYLCLLDIVFIGAVDNELNHAEGEQDNKMELSYIEKVNKQWFKRIKRYEFNSS